MVVEYYNLLIIIISDSRSVCLK